MYRPVEIETSIPERFQQHVESRGGSPAVITPARSLTYHELNLEVNRVSSALCAAGIKRGERVAIIMEQETWLIAAILGVLRCAAIYVPIDPKWSVERGQQVIGDAQPRVVLADSINLFRAQLLQVDQQILNGELLVSDASLDTAQIETGLVEPAADDLAYIYYTSGSTGQAKGVADTHRNVLHNVSRYTENLHIAATDRLTLVQTCGFSGAVSNVFGALANGAALLPVDISRMTPTDAAHWFQKVGATIYHSVPSVFRLIAKTGVHINTLRVIRLEGDVSNNTDLELFNACFDETCVLVNGLGATETGIVAQHVMRHGDVIQQSFLPIGISTADTSIRIVDQHGRELPHGSVGEIEVTSDYLAYGYWHRPELTRAAFKGADDRRRSYRTGDLGLLRSDGVLEYRGRSNARIKISGEWLDLSELESVLLASPRVENAVVTAAAGEDGGPQPKAWIVPSEAAEHVGQLVADCRQNLLDTCGRHIDVAIVDALPLDLNGKISRQSNHANHQSIPPETPTEKQVAEVFADILNLPNVGVESDFFSLGGDSLAAVAASDAIDRKLGTSCALGLLQHAPVVRELARLIDNAGGTTEVLVPLQPQGSNPPIFCVHAHMGHVFNLRALASHFAPHTPFIGIQAIGLTGDQQPQESIHEMAQAYVDAVRQRFPSGPYLIAGYCLGSLVAVEMARLLEEQGSEVKFVALLDPDIPGYNQNTRHSIRNLFGALRRPSYQLVRNAVNRIFRNSKKLLLSKDASSSANLPLREDTPVAQALMRAYQNYEPGGFSGTVHIFSPQPWAQSAQSACEKWLAGQFRVIELNAPIKDMMKGPWARQLADAIRGCLRATRKQLLTETSDAQ